jgi:cystathionine beta-lyase
MSALQPGLDIPIERLRARRSAKWTKHPPDVLPAWVAEMDFELAPPVAEALHRAVDLGDIGYAEVDYRGLRDAFAGFAARRLGWEPDAERVRLIPDVVVGIVEILRLLLGPGDRVVINPPVYYPFFHAIPEAGCAIEEVPFAADGALDLDGLAAAFAGGARAYLLCSPHNPTGRVHSRAELEAVAALAAEHGVWVLADEIHAPLVLDGPPSPPFLGLGAAACERGVVLTSASKAFNLPGLKAALTVTASETADAALSPWPEALAPRSGHLGILASEAAFAGGDAWLDAVLARLLANRALVAARLGERLPTVRYTPGAASYLAWLDCRELGLGDDPAAVFLERGHVALSSGPPFGALAGAGHARLNFATSPGLVEEIVERMAVAL